MGEKIRRLVVAWAVFLAVVAALGFWSDRAHADGGFSGMSTELTQLANNTELLLEVAHSAAIEAQQLQQTYLQTMQQFGRTVNSISSPTSQLRDNYVKVNNALRLLNTMVVNVERLDSVLDGRYRDFSASNLTWDGYIARERRLIQGGDQRARAAIKSDREVMQQAQQSISAYQTAAADLENTEGTHQATRILGAQLGVLGGDINRMLVLTAQNHAMDAERQQEEAARRDANLSEAERLRTAQRDLNQRRQAELDAILRRVR